MHAIGFWHEHMRADRAKYIYLNLAKLNTANPGQYDLISNGQGLNTPYDYQSVMHYGADADMYAINPKGAKIPGPQDRADADIPSKLDVQAIKAYYC